MKQESKSVEKRWRTDIPLNVKLSSFHYLHSCENTRATRLQGKDERTILTNLT